MSYWTFLIWNETLQSIFISTRYAFIDVSHFYLLLRWLNTVLQALSGIWHDGTCFKLDKQSWWRKNNGTQKTISQNLLIKIL